MSPRTILIPVTIGEDYPNQLRKRLIEYGIKQSEICDEIGMEPTQFSRMFNDEKPVDPRVSTVAKIEAAIIKLRRKKAREKRRAAKE